MRTTIFIQDGNMTSIGDMPVELGVGIRKRASNILPLHRGKRVAFLALRLLFGERGTVAEFTRRWHGPWICRIFRTGETYIHPSRQCCLRWEHQRLEKLLSL